jgi:L-ascorbate metabolism protein UlaG (beta-lactamase superfamily)
MLAGMEVPASGLGQASAEAGRITFLGHAGFRINTPGGKVVLIDPWLKDNPVCPPHEKHQPAADLILLTHGHPDHLDADLPALAERTGALIISPPQVRFYLQQRGLTRFRPMNKGGTVPVHGMEVTMVNAFHHAHIQLEDGATGFPHEAVGYVLRLENGFRLYHAGDTCVFGDMRLIGEIYRPDLAMLPIGDRFTMGPLEAAHAIRLLGVKRVIPMHYDSMPSLTGTPEALQSQTADIEGLQIHVLKPGQTL